MWPPSTFIYRPGWGSVPTCDCGSGVNPDSGPRVPVVPPAFASPTVAIDASAYEPPGTPGTPDTWGRSQADHTCHDVATVIAGARHTLPAGGDRGHLRVHGLWGATDERWLPKPLPV